MWTENLAVNFLAPTLFPVYWDYRMGFLSINQNPGVIRILKVALWVATLIGLSAIAAYFVMQFVWPTLENSLTPIFNYKISWLDVGSFRQMSY